MFYNLIAMLVFGLLMLCVLLLGLLSSSCCSCSYMFRMVELRQEILGNLLSMRGLAGPGCRGKTVRSHQ